MARRTRSSRAWHFVLSGVRHEADSRAVALASGARGWGYDSDGQVGGCWGCSTARGTSLSPLTPGVAAQGLCNQAAGAAARSWPKSGNSPNKLYRQAGEMEVVAASKL